jgi:cell division protein FtsB
MNNLGEKQKEIDSLEREIEELELRLEGLNNDPEELERFARENFLMKKENEDIVIIKDQ